jgi:hypothetical protein
MDWITTSLLHLREELSAAQVEQAVRREEYRRAYEEREAADGQVRRLHTAIAALEQLDPITRLPEAPL